MSNKMLLPGKSYQISIQFCAEYQHHANRFEIVRPMKPNGYKTGFLPYPRAVNPPSHISTIYPSIVWRKRTSINTVMGNCYYSEGYGLHATIKVSRGTSLAKKHGREGGWDFYCQLGRAISEYGNMPDMVMASAKFELDYNDGSNGKLNFVYSVDNKERKHLIIEGLTCDYVWAGVMGVYHDGVTTMEISSG